MPTEMPASRPCASITLALRSFDWLMIADDAQRPRCVATSKQIVSKAPRMMPAVTGSTCGARRERRAARDEPAVHLVGQRRLPQLTDRQPA